MATETNRVGITDIPCSRVEEDLLGIGKYVNGLQKFIRHCPTPMSIAVQGDWGTGKTSTIKMVQEQLEKDKDTNNIRCIFFNTWQYSQFNMEDSLYISLVHNLVNEIARNSEEAKKFYKTIKELGKWALLNYASRISGMNFSELCEVMYKDKNEPMANISNLENEFRNLVKNTGKRLVIFVDDLDRLNPEVAVELLEVIKLFMSVENCIFVLAIDYDVVVSGVRKKYGENLSDEKCRSFFDKIIQLPFTMPVQEYKLEKLLETMIPQNPHNKKTAEFIGDVMGTTPRNFKRLVNSFFLIQSVNEAEKTGDTDAATKKLEDALMLCILCVQMCSPKLYNMMLLAAEDGGPESDGISRLLSASDETRCMKEYFKDLDETDKEFAEIEGVFHSFKDAVLVSIPENGEISKDNVLNILSKLLKTTSITNISDRTASQRKTSVKVTRISINGESCDVSSANEAIAKTFNMLLQGKKEYVSELMRKYSGFLTTPEEGKENSVFRQKRDIFRENGFIVQLGVSTGTNVKKEHVQKLHQFLESKGESNRIQWFDGESEILSLGE
ncbi:MAG: AAA family ATPase [Butyricicoccus pullicaecorum]|nr:AAA family ATPase [Butyricicoccus pullicaecorum]